MSTRDPLAEVLIPHLDPCSCSQAEFGLYVRWIRCRCGWESPKSETLVNLPDLRRIHAAHLAAAVRAFLASDETVERAAEGITDAHWCESNYTRGCNCREYRVSEARAALAAATEARPC